MIEPEKWGITTLIRCENENCGGVCFADDLEQSGWECPYCGKLIGTSAECKIGISTG